jgi:hypothetical protein
MTSMAIRLLVGARAHSARIAAALALVSACVAAPAQTVTYIHNDPAGNPVLATREWRWFPGDRWHNPHWDHNSHDKPSSPWTNVDHGGLPSVKPVPDPKP